MVDDDDLVRGVLVAVLRAAGHTVEYARDGREALDLVAQHEAFDLILMDLTMPVLDGWSTVQKLRAGGIGTPIVIMSGHTTRAEALRSGADAFLAKPFDRVGLVDAVERWATPTFKGLGSAAG